MATLELLIKFLKEGQKRGLDPSLRKDSIKSSLAHHTMEPILKVGEILGPPLSTSQTLRTF